jgi:hypothetical protein
LKSPGVICSLMRSTSAPAPQRTPRSAAVHAV